MMENLIQLKNVQKMKRKTTETVERFKGFIVTCYTTFIVVID